MGFLGISGKNWKNVGKWALRAAPIVAAPFTGGASLLAIGAGAGAASGALGGGGLKGALLGGALGAIPGGGAGGAAASTGVKAGLKQGLTQVGKKLGTQAAFDVGGKLGGQYLGGTTAGALAGGVGSALTGGGVKGFAKGAASGARASVKDTAIGAGQGLAAHYLGGPAGGGMTYENNNIYRNSLGQNAAPTGRSSVGLGSLGKYGGGSSATGGDQPNFWGKWGPLITTGAGAVVGGVMANKAQKSAEKRSPEELAALQGAQGAAGALGKGGESLLSESRPYIKGPANYYQALLKGNRAAMTQAVAPAAAQVAGTYRGAERDLDRMGVRGAQRDVAASELSRTKASQIAGLTTGVQPAAADALAGLGTNLLSQAGPMLGNAGNIYGNLLTGGLANRQQAALRGEKAGQAWGGIVRDIGEAIPTGGKKKPKLPPAPAPTRQGYGGMTPSVLPGRPTVPTISNLPTRPEYGMWG